LKKEKDDQVHKHQKELEAQFRQWRTVELLGMIFSVAGLALAIIEYECDLGDGGFKGLGLVPEKGPDTNGEVQKAIADRLDGPWTTTLRMLNVLSSILAISMLVLRNYLKVNWTNTLFNE